MKDPLFPFSWILVELAWKLVLQCHRCLAVIISSFLRYTIYFIEYCSESEHLILADKRLWTLCPSFFVFKLFASINLSFLRWKFFVQLFITVWWLSHIMCICLELTHLFFISFFFGYFTFGWIIFSWMQLFPSPFWTCSNIWWGW